MFGSVLVTWEIQSSSSNDTVIDFNPSRNGVTFGPQITSQVSS